MGLSMEGGHTLHTLVVVATVRSLTLEAAQDFVAVNVMPQTPCRVLSKAEALLRVGILRMGDDGQEEQKVGRGT